MAGTLSSYSAPVCCHHFLQSPSFLALQGKKKKKVKKKKGPNNPKESCLLWTIRLISYCRRGYKTVKLKRKLESAYRYSVVRSDAVIWSMVFDQNSKISLEVKFLLYVGKTLKVQNEFIFKWTSSLTASRSSEPLSLKTIWTH